MQDCSSAGTRPPVRCWSGCRGWWRAGASWWCPGCRGGVLPRIRAAGLAAAPGAAAWPRVVLTPTRAPLDELALQVGVLAGTDAAVVRRGLEAAPAWFALTARQ